METGNRRVKTLETSLRIIEVLHEREGGRPSGLANALGLGKSTIHDHLSTLANMDTI